MRKKKMSKVRIPKQHRSVQTKNRITKAGFQLFSHKGIHGTTSKEIADKAGVAIGSFYAYFKNKKQLLLEILENFLDKIYTMIWKDLNSYTIKALREEDIKSIIANVFKAYDIAPLFLSQTHTLRYSDPDINRIFEKEREREVNQILKLMESNKSRLHLRDAYAAAIIIHNSVESVAHTAKFIGPHIEESRFIDELTAIIFDYLSSERHGKRCR